MAANLFREDLFHRLAVVPLHVPALRERAEDIPQLVEHFLVALAGETGRRAPSFTAAALEALRRYPFPGNVRELKNLVERLVIMNPGARIGPEHVAAVLPAAVAGGPAAAPEAPAELSQAVHEFERRHIEAALAAEGGNMTRAAARLGLERSHLYKKMRQLGLRVEA
jgi:DNA-binding NtrC family response regulator